MSKMISFSYGIIAYVVFFLSFVYAIGFTGSIVVPKAINTGFPSGTLEALAINLLLLGFFALQHTIMARPAFKAWFTKFVPVQVERSTFVLAASLLLLLLYWQWRPMTGVIWSVENTLGRTIILGIFWIGWVIVFISTFLINHFDLFGLRQVYFHLSGREYSHPQFTTTGLYKYIRHPIMLGFIIAFWATPLMTVGHLLFAVGTTGYIIIGVHLEERDLRQALGSEYDRYQKEVPMLCPFAKKAAK